MKLWREWSARQPLLLATAAAHALLFLACLALALIDDTQITGLNRWIKPAKFASSIAIFLGTMAWYWPVAIARDVVKHRAAYVLSSTLILEMVIIFAQAARGLRSHFNFTTIPDAILFQIMGLAIAANVVTAAIVLRWTFRAAPSAYVWGVRLGLLLFVVFASAGGLMVRYLAHTVGAPDGGPGLPFFNWSTRAGDLRVAHFFGMHALQALPLLGFATRSTPAVVAAFGAWAALAGALLRLALAGFPLIRG